MRIPHFSIHSAYLTAFRPIEPNPDREIVSKVFKTMHGAGSGREKICRTELLPAFTTNKLTATGGDKIDLVACVGSLRISSARRVDLDRQSSMMS